MSAVASRPEPATGQRWALHDHRYGRERYLTVTAVSDGRVRTTSGGRRRAVSFRRDRFGHGSKWTFCGHDGPGRDLPAYSTGAAVTAGCGNCPPRSTVLSFDAELHVGDMDDLVITRDGELTHVAVSGALTMRWVEQHLVARAPDADWRLRREGMLSGQLYQRQSTGWVLIAIGMGFA